MALRSRKTGPLLPGRRPGQTAAEPLPGRRGKVLHAGPDDAEAPADARLPAEKPGVSPRAPMSGARARPGLAAAAGAVVVLLILYWLFL
jgi:hypothetical protein